MFLAKKKKVQCLILKKKNASFHFICLLYETKRITVLSVNVFVQTWHISCSVAGLQSWNQRGLKKEQMNLQEYLFSLILFLKKAALVHCVVASKVSLKVQDVSLCGLIFTSSCFHAKRRRCCRTRETRLTFVGVEKLKVFVRGVGRKSVFHLKF